MYNYNYTTNNTHINNRCYQCNSEIPNERLEALKSLGILPPNYLCLSCANNVNNTYKAVYDGKNFILATGLGQYGIPKEEETEILEIEESEELNENF